MLRRQRIISRRSFTYNEQLLKLKEYMISCGLHLDETLGMMTEARVKKRYGDVVRKLSKELHFTYNEIECLVLMYYKFQQQEKEPQMSRYQFNDVLHEAFDMTDTKFNDSVNYTLDKSPSCNFSMESWVRAFSLFLRGTFDEKLRFCYNVYDVMGEGMIPRERMLHLLSRSMIGEDDTDDAARDLIDIIVKKMDKDRDGKISFNDFREAVSEEPLMMEAFGQCLPTRLAVHAFLVTFTRFSGKKF